MFETAQSFVLASITCPITKQIFNDPVINPKDNLTYEHDATDCKQVISNLVIKKLVANYLKDNPKEKRNQYKPKFDTEIILKHLKNNEVDRLLCYDTFSFQNAAFLIKLLQGIREKDEDVMKHVIDITTDLTHACDDKNYPIHYFSQYAPAEILKYFLSKVKNHSVTVNNKDILVINLLNNKGLTPLHIILQRDEQPYEKDPLVKYLMEFADCDVTCANPDGVRPIHLIFEHCCSTDIFNICDDHHQNARMDLNCEDKHGNRPIHYVLNGSRGGGIIMTILKFLKEVALSRNKIDFQAKNNNGDTPLIIAIKNKWYGTAEYLIDSLDIDLNTELVKNGVTLVEFAIGSFCHNDVCKFIQKYTSMDSNGKIRLGFNFTTANNWNLIHLVCNYCSNEHCDYYNEKFYFKDIVDMLIKNGVNHDSICLVTLTNGSQFQCNAVELLEIKKNQCTTYGQIKICEVLIDLLNTKTEERKKKIYNYINPPPAPQPVSKNPSKQDTSLLEELYDCIPRSKDDLKKQIPTIIVSLVCGAIMIGLNS